MLPREYKSNSLEIDVSHYIRGWKEKLQYNDKKRITFFYQCITSYYKKVDVSRNPKLGTNLTKDKLNSFYFLRINRHDLSKCPYFYT